VVGSGFNLITDPNSLGYTGSFIADVSSINQIVAPSVSNIRGDDSPASPTPMILITGNSLARDAIPVSSCRLIVADQGGASRPDGFSGLCDIGAHEFTEFSCTDKRNIYEENNQFSFSNCGAVNEFIVGYVNTTIIFFLFILTIVTVKRESLSTIIR
jgi:hypothetical protein